MQGEQARLTENIAAQRNPLVGQPAASALPCYLVNKPAVTVRYISRGGPRVSTADTGKRRACCDAMCHRGGTVRCVLSPRHSALCLARVHVCPIGNQRRTLTAHPVHICYPNAPGSAGRSKNSMLACCQQTVPVPSNAIPVLPSAA